MAAPEATAGDVDALDAQSQNMALSVSLALLDSAESGLTQDLSVDAASGDIPDGDPRQKPSMRLSVETADASGDIPDGDPKQKPSMRLSVETADASGDIPDGDPKQKPSMRLEPVTADAGGPKQKSTYGVTASYVARGRGSVRLMTVPSQVLVIRRRKLDGSATSHYVLLGPIPGKP